MVNRNSSILRPDNCVGSIEPFFIIIWPGVQFAYTLSGPKPPICILKAINKQLARIGYIFYRNGDGSSDYVKPLPGHVLTRYNTRRTFHVKASFAYHKYRFFEVITAEPEFLD